MTRALLTSRILVSFNNILEGLPEESFVEIG